MVEEREELKSLKPYVRPPLVNARVKLNQNESPFDVPNKLKREIIGLFKEMQFNRYPEGSSEELRKEIAAYCGTGCKPENVLGGNGIDEVLYCLMMAYIGKNDTVIYGVPTFPIYEICAKIMGAKVEEVELDAETFALPSDFADKCSGKIVVICTPNANTGNTFSEEEIRKVAGKAKMVIVDQAYAEFAGLQPIFGGNIVCLRTMSKAFCAAGLRLGYAIADERIVQGMDKVRLPWNLNSLSQAAGLVFMRNRAEFEKGVNKIIKERNRVYKKLKRMNGVEKVWASEANFLLFRVNDAKETYAKMLGQGVQVRDVSSYPLLANCLRVSVGSGNENDEFLAALEKALNG
ncbi:Aspartate aminotransferase [Candidatus Gugararchaeum adminiculabundum]|nr:Aspartate aminotransferase [Candidatus Gugararchaeum adminiculabundum]